MNDTEDDGNQGLVIYTAAEIQSIGLDIVGYKQNRIQRAKPETNRYRFRVHFGSDPKVIATIFADLQTTTVAAAFIPPGNSRNIRHFLMAMHFLKVYPTEIQREATFDVSPAWGRDWCWYFIEKVQALKVSKIVWPEDNGGNDIWILSVDGIHCWTNEYIHPIWSKNSKIFSHKYSHAGLCYELGILLAKDQVCSMKGAYDAGANDITNFTRPNGLKEKLVSVGKKGVGDAAYNGHY